MFGRLKAYPGNVAVDQTLDYAFVRQREGNELGEEEKKMMR